MKDVETEGKQATKLKILLALKFDIDGNVDRYKARMVNTPVCQKNLYNGLGENFCASRGKSHGPTVLFTGNCT